jgi:hypothetical protein
MIQGFLSFQASKLVVGIFFWLCIGLDGLQKAHILACSENGVNLNLLNSMEGLEEAQHL